VEERERGIGADWEVLFWVGEVEGGAGAEEEEVGFGDLDGFWGAGCAGGEEEDAIDWLV
jgi:hypothetical protein